MTGDLNSDVSRETLEELKKFGNLVEKWTQKINLISKESRDSIWERHIVDSAQVFDLAPKSGHWVDLGAGGGFPGIVAAVLAKGAGMSHRFTLIESDHRKSVFLRTAVRELKLQADVITARIESIDCINADILSARALADLDILLGFAEQHLAQSGVALFMKGSRWEKESEEASKRWSYSAEAIKSKTNANAAVLKIKDISRV